ncbi:uncharacterized protein H6S33_000595 [Morchella sextelata]|uniref:uncharacterized protein n=1 Tax=Morchella sextelata TaxID=1174677 RepID=UPI001D04EC2F|nr:uncharacterized protein H6S33_000595 [Morchella sextelata]KAH0614959.1 hypothetical protein H6S33_000595 [Morchella sextelata]
MSVTTSRPSPRSSLEFSINNTNSAQSHIRPQHPAPVQPTSHPATVPVPASNHNTPSSGGGGGYFGLVIDSADNQPNATNNWSSSGSSVRSTAARSPRPVHLDNVSTLFQKQSEAIAMSLQLNRTNSVNDADYASSEHFDDRSSFSPLAPGSYVNPLNVPPTPDVNSVNKDPLSSLGAMGHNANSSTRPSIFNGTYMASPVSFERGLSAFTRPSDSNLSRLSAPSSPQPPNLTLTLPNIALQRKKSHGRSATLPNPSKEGQPVFVSASTLSDLLEGKTSSLLLLDVRTYKVFAQSRITKAVNLCIPTTLLKRPSFNVTKLSETFAKEEDKERFARWKDMKYIVVYDSESQNDKDAAASAPLHTLSKFVREGWKGQAYILKGGFNEFSMKHPEKIDKSQLVGATSPKSLSLTGKFPGAQKGVGPLYCPMPTSQKTVANPFFSNIRQNMDLIGGVGEIPITLPQNMGKDTINALPSWLRNIALDKNASKIIADKFLSLEKAEQRRMQDALNVSVVYDSPLSTTVKPHVLAGVEKGNKNRYNNIWPYDHARVKLQDYPDQECDYVNASHVSTKNSSKRYIASQAPLPATFRDFWSMVWEQDVRVIVMLTAEEEGGQVKSHRYWESKKYGPLKLASLSEVRVSLDPSYLKASPKRRSTESHANGPPPLDSNIPFVIVRKFTLEHMSHPFSPMREITQLQYSSWPDFGAPAHPAHILGLIEHTDAVVRSSGTTDSSSSPSRRPVLVHCSAGCGRTGAFCAIDSVISMLQSQRLKQKRLLRDGGDSCSDGEGHGRMGRLGLSDSEEKNGDWLLKDNEDLISKAVADLRDQRLSMVQSLRQFVLCYETVLEWSVRQNPIDSGKRKA